MQLCADRAGCRTLGEGAGELPRDLVPTMRATADGVVRCAAARLPNTCAMKPASGVRRFYFFKPLDASPDTAPAGSCCSRSLLCSGPHAAVVCSATAICRILWHML